MVFLIRFQFYFKIKKKADDSKVSLFIVTCLERFVLVSKKNVEVFFPKVTKVLAKTF